MSTSNAAVDDIIERLESLKPFSYSSYVDSIKQIIGVNDQQWSSVCTSKVYGEDPGNDPKAIDRFKVETVALGVSRTSSYGFNNQVVKTRLEGKITTSASRLVVPVYRRYLEDHIASGGGNHDILALVQDANFCHAWAEKVLDATFINDALIARYFGQAQYTEAIAYIYERARETLAKQPAKRVIRIGMPAGAFPHSISAPQLALSSLPHIDVFASTARTNALLLQRSAVDGFLAKALPLQWSDDVLLQGPSFPDLGTVWSANWQADTYATDVANGLIGKVTRVHQQPFRTARTSVARPDKLIHGDALWKWLELKQKSGYGDLFQVVGTEIEETSQPSGGSCFSPGTLVETAQGPRAIHSLTGADQVLTRAPGVYAPLSDEKVAHDVRPALSGHVEHVVTLYGFNGSDPFFTAGHIFFTVSGPKAVNPELARAENPNVHVGQLSEGDRLFKVNAQKTGYDQVDVRSIDHETATCEIVYGLHFARGAGGGRYHANGYWVGENYPDVTIKSLHDGFSTLSLAEQHSFLRQIRALPNTFRQVFGNVVFDTFQKSFLNAAKITHSHSAPSSMLKQVEKTAPRHLPVKAVQAKFHLLHAENLQMTKARLDTTHPDFKGHLEKVNGGLRLPDISLHHGTVLLDGQLVKHASMSHLGVHFSHEIPEEPGVFQHAVLRSIGHGMALAGVMAKGPANATSVKQFTSVQNVTAMASANVYSLDYSPRKFTTIKDAEAATPGTGQKWSHFWNVSVGLSQNDGGLSVVLKMPDLDKEFQRQHPDATDLPSLYSMSPASLNPKNYTVLVPVKVTPGFESFLQDCISQWKAPSVTAGPAFKTFTVLLNLTTNVVHGYCTELSEDASGNYTDGPIHALFHGASPTIAALKQQATEVASAAHAPDVHAKVASVHEPTASLHQPALPATETLSTMLFAGSNLSIIDLQTGLSYPSDTDLNKLAQKYMQNAATYWRAQTEIDVFGNEQSTVKDTLPKTLLHLSSDDQTFFGQYGRALIMQSLSTNQTYSGKFSASDHETMRYYWIGSQKGCLSQGTAYNRVTKVSATASFLTQSPGLNAYIADSQDWAAKFFAFLTTDEQLNNQALAMFFNSTDNLTNRYCMTLGALDQQNRNFDVQLWNQVRDKLLMRPATGTITDTSGKDFPAFAVQFATELIINIQSGQGGDLKTQLGIDLAQIEQVFGTQTAAQTAGQMYSASSQLGRCFLNAFRQLGNIVANGGLGNFAKLMEKVNSQVTTNFPKLSKILPYLGGITAMCVQGFAIYSAVKLLMNWNNLSPQDRANAILAIVNAECAYLVQRFRGKAPTDFDYKITCVKWNQETGQEAPKTNKQVEKANGAVEVQPVLDEKAITAVDSAAKGKTESEQFGKAVTRAGLTEELKTFNLGEAAVGTLGVAANIAAAVCLGFQIADDFQSGQPAGIKAMDILTEAATVAQVIIGSVEVGFAVSGVMSAALPVVGAVVAIIGIVMMFVELFVPHTPPQDPVNKYLDSQKSGFLSPIPAPPKPELTYVVSPTKFTEKKQATLTITVTDPQNTKTAINSISVRLLAGDADNALFAAPAGDDGNGNPASNVVAYAVDRTDFAVSGSKFAGTADSAVVTKVTSTETAVTGTVVGSKGLVITITGTVNGVAGTPEIIVTEGAASRPDGIIASDVYSVFNVTKAA